MQLRSVIIDDDKFARSYLRDLHAEFCPQIEIVAELESTVGAAAFLDEHPVDVIFLDIEMPELDGISFAHGLQNKNTQLIFVTAHMKYAIPALREGAVDFLLKPINKKEFKEAVMRAENNLLIRKASGFASGEYFSKKIELHYLKGFKLVALRDIISLEANSNYTIVYLTNGEQIVVSRSLITFEKKLDSVFFFRIHKSHIINLLHFREYYSEEGGSVLLSDNRKLFVSRYRQQSFFRVVSHITGNLKV